MAKNEEVVAEEVVAPAETTETAETAEQGQTGIDSISLQDLQVLANVVDLATQRGAFRGNELTQVGAVFDKLSGFLQQVAAAQAENAEGEESAEGTQEA